MKKIFIFVAICSIALTVNAQFFIGGQFGLGINSTREKTNKSIKPVGVTTTTGGTAGVCTFVIAPRLGYCINDKWAVGADIPLTANFNTTVEIGNIDKKKDTKTTHSITTFTWGIAPFVRYTFFTYQRFSLGVEGNIGIGSRHQFEKTKTPDNTTTVKHPYWVRLDVFNIKPVMALRLKNKLFLEATLNILGFHYGIEIQPPQADNVNGKRTVTNHSFGLNIRELTHFTLGIVYKFK